MRCAAVAGMMAWRCCKPVARCRVRGRRETTRCTLPAWTWKACWCPEIWIAFAEESGIPEPQELLDRYAEIVGFDLRKDGGGKDWDTAVIFHYLRGGTITHGIQARTINGQASSKFSHIYFGHTKASLDAAFERVQKLESEAIGGPKL